MQEELTVLGISAVVLLVLTALFRIEAKKKKRFFLSTVRGWLDAVVASVTHQCVCFFAHMRAGMMRTTVHYVVHHILGSIILFLTGLQKKLFRLYEKNKWQQKVSLQNQGGDAHLNAIAEHKKDTALTAAQKRKMRKH